MALVILASGAGALRAGNGLWQTSGPGGRSPFAHDVFALAVDPNDPSTLYASHRAWGIVKSLDGGRAWFAANLGVSSNEILALAVDPKTSSTVYALSRDSRVFKSVDAGAHWVDAGGGSLPLPGFFGLRGVLAIDPKTTTTLYMGLQAGHAGGFFKSIDGGVTWADAGRGFGQSDVSVTSAAIDPDNPETLYVSTVFAIYKSNDGGGTWATVSETDYAEAVVVDPTNPSTVYATAYPGVVIRSTNGGASWTTMNANFPNHDISCLALEPANPSTVYMGTRDAGVFKSTDSGGAWQSASQGFTFPGFTYARVTALAAAPGAVYAVSFGLLFKSGDLAATWVQLPEPDGVNVQALATVRAAPQSVFAGTDMGVFRSSDAGASWQSVNAGLGQPYVSALAMDPLVPTTLYLTDGAGGVFKSTNSGDSWALVKAGSFSSLVVDPVNPSILYAGGVGVSKSTDGGATWSSPTPPGLVTNLAIDPVTPSRLYAIVDGSLYRSTDSAVSWVRPTPGLGPSPSVFALAVDPTAGATLYAATASQGVLRSTDFGDTWTPVNIGLATLETRGLVIDANTPSTLFVSTPGNGVFRSQDAGAHWAPFNKGLTNGWISVLAHNPAADTLYAGAFVGGVWQLRSATGAFHTVAPCRAVDTRSADGPALAAGSTRTFKLVGRCSIPLSAGSLSLNVTVSNPTSPGHIRVFPGNTALAPNSTLNFAPGQTRANNAVSLLGAAGDVAVFSGQASGSVHLIIDVNGYFE